MGWGHRLEARHFFPFGLPRNLHKRLAINDAGCLALLLLPGLLLLLLLLLFGLLGLLGGSICLLFFQQRCHDRISFAGCFCQGLA